MSSECCGFGFIPGSSCEPLIGAFILLSPLFFKLCATGPDGPGSARSGAPCGRARNGKMIFYRVSQGGAPSARCYRPSNPFYLFYLLSGGGFAWIFQHAALDLIELDRFEQRAEITFAEALVALALDDLEEDRTDDVLREDLQQQLAFRLGAAAVDQDAQAAQVFQTLAVVRQAAVHQLVVGLDGVLEGDAGVLHALDRRVDVVAAQRDVLAAFAVVLVEVLRYLRFVVRRLVDRKAHLAARGRHGFRFQAGQLAFDVEIAHFAEVEHLLVEVGPFLHAAAMDVVGQVVDIGQAMADRIGLRARDGDEVHVVDADVADGALLAAVLALPAVDQVDQRIADALDGGDVQLHRAGLVVETPGAQFQRALVGMRGVVDADGDGAHGRAVVAREALRERVLLGVDDEVDVALAVQRHVLVAVAGDGGEAHALEQRTERLRIGCG